MVVVVVAAASTMVAGKSSVNPMTSANPWYPLNATNDTVACSLGDLFSVLHYSEEEEAGLVELIAILARMQNKAACLVIDEANQVTTAKDTALIARIINLTKANFKMNAMLSTSVHSYPHKMTEQFQLDFAETLFVEEFSPSIMWNVLTTEQDEHGNKVLGMGQHLARLCVASFGGNLLRVKVAIVKLKKREADFTAFGNILYNVDGSEAIPMLLKDKAVKPGLIALAKRGYGESTIEN